MSGAAKDWRGSAEERFARKIIYAIDGSECINWTGSRNDRGYGHFSVNGRLKPAHVWAWEQINGPVPEGLELDHLCRNTSCVNPAHLEPVTHRENVLRGAGTAATNARKSTCPRGHTYDRRTGGARVCSTCKRDQMAAFKARRAERAA